MSTVALFGLAQFRIEMAFLVWLGVMLSMGVLTFRRLVERRIRGMEYLRALNRIHRYFVDNDPSLETYYYWPPCDDVPFHGGGSTAVAGLLDVIAAVNRLFGRDSRWGGGIRSVAFSGFGDIRGLGYSGSGHHLVCA